MSKSSNQGSQETIDIYGAREHNLKDINLQIPRNKLIVFTGLSGSGKSSLAFDTIFAEGQRRYIDTFSSYVKQFIGGLPDGPVPFHYPQNAYAADLELSA